jgi:NADH:ubiquinone oxidoreductase subunit 2 (subunit N)
MRVDLDTRYRTLLTLWFALLLSIGSFFVFTLFAVNETGSEPGRAPNTVLVVALTAVGTFLVVVSFAVKRKLLERSVEKQDLGLVQTALVVACAMCEASVIIGVLERLMLGTREYYLLFLVGAIGMLLHFPRRDHLLAASYKTIKDGSAS